MDNQGERGPRAYRFTLTAVSFGKDEDEALENLMDVLGRSAIDAIDENITYESLDYVYVVREDLTPEA